MKPKKVELEPVDVKQCQAEKPNGHTFMTLGGVPGLVRCKNKPACVVLETVPDPKDGLQGAMSLCTECFEQLFRQRGLNNIKLESIQLWQQRQ